MEEFSRIKRLPPYVFNIVNQRKAIFRAAGEDIVDFGMGNPDQPAPQHIIDKLVEAAQREDTHRYSLSKGIPRLRRSICNWYQRKFNVELDPEEEAIVTIGSNVPVGEDIDFFAELEKAIRDTWPKPKLIILNFPANPTAQCVDLEFFERVVAIAREHNIYVINDIAYAEITFDGYQPPSILQVAGAQDIAAEFYSLSKTYNMPGWRVGFMCGNKTLVSALAKLKSYLDYGMFTPIQVAAIAALDGPQDCVEDIRAMYRSRRDVLIEGLNSLGWEVTPPKATMFVWAKIPEQFAQQKSLDFSMTMLETAKVAVSPGVGFGAYGDDHVRFSLIENEHRTRQAIRGIKKLFRDNK